MDLHTFTKEYHNLTKKRRCELWRSFAIIVYSDVEAYESFILEAFIHIVESGAPYTEHDPEVTVANVLGGIFTNEESNYTELEIEILELACEFEQDDYFGTEGARL